MEDLHLSREDLSEAESVDVYIRVCFTKINDVDTVNQRYQAEALIETKWFDSSLKTLNDDATKLKWKPELYIENSINDPKEETSYKIVTGNNNELMVSEIKKVKGMFWENLELENFPLDIQDLSLTIATKKSGNKVNFILMQPELCKISITSTLDKSMWHLHDMVKTTKEKISREYSFGKRDYPCVKMTCQVFRSPGYFYWNVILPVLLITIASLGPFVIDYKLPQSRLPSTATMLLSSVSYKVSVSRLLPTVSYLTTLDKYCLGSIVVITAMLLYHALCAGIAAFFSDILMSRVDKAFFFIFFALIVLKQVVCVVWLFRVNSLREILVNQSMFYDPKIKPSISKEKLSNVVIERSKEE